MNVGYFKILIMGFQEEDFERAILKDQMYLEEHQRELEAEYQQWEEEHKLPVKIELITPKIKKTHGRD
jgi:hypothetical protein